MSLEYVFCLLICITTTFCRIQTGPDPWNYESQDLTQKIKHDANVPPDLRIYPKKSLRATQDSLSNSQISELFFRKMLGIVLKGGQVKKKEDNTVEISLQIRLDKDQWDILDGYMKSSTALTDEMIRRSVGYIEEAIYKPSIVEKIAMAWSDYVHDYITEYKNHITWTLAVLGGAGLVFWLWTVMSHRHMIIVIFLALYSYEIFVSYKEAEKQELDSFVTALNACKWKFWSSNCDLPAPDPLTFLKHMNPLKIGIRMFTTLISEPLVTLSGTMKIVVHGITDGLWFPFDKIMYAILLLSFNVMLLFLLVMIIFNYILNIPFKLSFLGLISVGALQRNRNLFGDPNRNNRNVAVENGERISTATLDKILDVCNKALHTAQTNTSSNIKREISSSSANVSGIKKSASTGRLDLCSYESQRPSMDNVRKRKNIGFEIGAGDAV